jgi:hypothetical protein
MMVKPSISSLNNENMESNIDEQHNIFLLFSLINKHNLILFIEDHISNYFCKS